MRQLTTIMTISAVVAVLAGMLVPPLQSFALDGTQGCAVGYWKNSVDTNPRIAELYGINLNAAILDITGLNLGAPETLTIDQALVLKGGGNNGLYRALGAAVFNTYYGDSNGDGVIDIDYIAHATLGGYVQQALNGDVNGAASSINAANDLGCPVDANGRVE